MNLFEGAAAETVSLRKFAEMMHLSLRAVQKAIKAGRIKKEASGRIEPISAAADWARNTQQRPNQKKKIADQKLPKNESPNFPRGSQDESKEPEPSGPEGAPPIGPPAGTRERSRRARRQYDYNDERAFREHCEAELARIKLEEAEGRLIPADRVREEATRTYRQFRDAILALPDRLAGMLTGETDQNKIHGTLTTELCKALNEFADTIVITPDDPGPAAGDAGDAEEAAA